MTDRQQFIRTYLSEFAVKFFAQSLILLSTFPSSFRDENPAKTDFFQHLIEDRTEAAFSYYEFLLNIQQQICK